MWGEGLSWGRAGVRNDFLVNLGTEAAVRYNDNSVNENGHAALTFEVLYQQANNFIEHMHEEQRRFFRRMIVSVVLSTDMSVHDEQIKVRCITAPSACMPRPSLRSLEPTKDHGALCRGMVRAGRSCTFR